MDGIRSYLISVVAVSMISVLASVLVKSSPLQKVVRLVGGLLILLVAVTPLLRLDMKALGEKIEEFCGSENFDIAKVELQSQNQLALYIKQTTEAYIENKANELGAAIQAEVTLTNGEYPMPHGVTIIGTLNVEQIKALSAYLTDALNIAEENQEWKLYGATE